MKPASFDYTQVKLQEQIPLRSAEIATLKQRVKDTRKLSLLIILIVSILLLCFFFYAQSPAASYNDEVTLLSALLVIFGVVCLVSWLIVVLDVVRAKKDTAFGKNVLKSVLIYKGRTKYGTYFIFAGRHSKENIRLAVQHPYYQLYQVGQQLTVHYLKYFKEIINIET